MACATLKRTLELDPLTCPRPSKRRRGLSLLSPRASYNSKSYASPPALSSLPSPFAVSGMSSEAIRRNVEDEMRRLYKRRRLNLGDEESGSVNGSMNETGGAANSLKAMLKQRERPIFSYQQVEMICEKMMREREKELFEKFTDILTAQLLDQYDTYVKYTHEEIKQKIKTEAFPSYLS